MNARVACANEDGLEPSLGAHVACADETEMKVNATNVGCRAEIDGMRNAKHGRVLCGTRHSLRPSGTAILAEVMAKQCIEANHAQRNRAAAKSSGDVCNSNVVGFDSDTTTSPLLDEAELKYVGSDILVK